MLRANVQQVGSIRSESSVLVLSPIRARDGNVDVVPDCETTLPQRLGIIRAPLSRNGRAYVPAAVAGAPGVRVDVGESEPGPFSPCFIVDLPHQASHF